MRCLYCHSEICIGEQGRGSRREYINQRLIIQSYRQFNYLHWPHPIIIIIITIIIFIITIIQSFDLRPVQLKNF